MILFMAHQNDAPPAPPDVPALGGTTTYRTRTPSVWEHDEAVALALVEAAL